MGVPALVVETAPPEADSPAALPPLACSTGSARLRRSTTRLSPRPSRRASTTGHGGPRCRSAAGGSSTDAAPTGWSLPSGAWRSRLRAPGPARVPQPSQAPPGTATAANDRAIPRDRWRRRHRRRAARAPVGPRRPVLSVDRLPLPASAPSGVEHLVGDLADIDLAPIAAFRPDTIIHLAATFERSVESPEFWAENWADNVVVSHRLVELAAAAGGPRDVRVRLELPRLRTRASTSTDTGPPTATPSTRRPDHAPQPVRRAKLYAEAEIEFARRRGRPVPNRAGPDLPRLRPRLARRRLALGPRRHGRRAGRGLPPGEPVRLRLQRRRRRGAAADGPDATGERARSTWPPGRQPAGSARCCGPSKRRPGRPGRDRAPIDEPFEASQADLQPGSGRPPAGRRRPTSRRGPGRVRARAGRRPERASRAPSAAAAAQVLASPIVIVDPEWGYGRLDRRTPEARPRDRSTRATTRPRSAPAVGPGPRPPDPGRPGRPDRVSVTGSSDPLRGRPRRLAHVDGDPPRRVARHRLRHRRPRRSLAEAGWDAPGPSRRRRSPPRPSPGPADHPVTGAAFVAGWRARSEPCVRRDHDAQRPRARPGAEQSSSSTLRRRSRLGAASSPRPERLQRPPGRRASGIGRRAMVDRRPGPRELLRRRSRSRPSSPGWASRSSTGRPTSRWSCSC